MMVEHLRIQIAKLRREQYGQRSERGRHLLDQMELQFEELEATLTEDECRAAAAAAKAKQTETVVKGFTRKPPARRPLPAHLPRERQVLPSPCACPDCGGKLSKIGEDITETLETIPRRYKVIQTVREKFSCRSCETISQPPAPFHPIARGRTGPNLLAMVLYGKYGNHQPLNRQSEGFAREGIDLSVSTLADHVGAATATLAPLNELIRQHVMGGERLHGDDTTVPVLAKLRTTTGRLWTYVRDDRPFGGSAPPAAVFFYSPDRAGEHPEGHLVDFTGILQADAYAGYNRLYDENRKPGSVIEAACWSHSRRKFFVLADIEKTATARTKKKVAVFSPLAFDAVRRIDAIFDLERPLIGLQEDERLKLRQQYVKPQVEALETWMRTERARLSRHNEVAKAMDYMLNRWAAFTRFLTNGKICLTNNASERALRCVAVGRRNWTFCGSDRGGQRAAAMYTLIATAKLNNIDPEAWLADVLRRISDHPASRLHELLPWNWRKPSNCEQQHEQPQAQAA
ncbi:MAG: IS66 family transposase [Rhodospirillaceae bacterium]